VKTKTKMPKQTDENQAPIHTAVMVQEVLQYLSPARGDRYLDLTAGYGGHAAAIQEAAGELAAFTLVDRDGQAARALADKFGAAAEIIREDFATASQHFASEGRAYDMILADLGASSLHLDQASRGFSFMREGPLDMRMDDRQATTAEQLINHSSGEELTRILRDYGEEPRAAIIAKVVVQNRPISSTTELAKLIEVHTPRVFGRRRINPATKTFQALRIAVNDELDQLSRSLPLWGRLLAPGGRLAVISFHSLEDRIVKQYFKEFAGNRYDAELTVLTKKPVTASHHEIVSNPRARSAKLRAGRKK
jgi:16S rRNA (cytosine1402-N4)-methyltransferase